MGGKKVETKEEGEGDTLRAREREREREGEGACFIRVNRIEFLRKINPEVPPGAYLPCAARVPAPRYSDERFTRAMNSRVIDEFIVRES